MWGEEDLDITRGERLGSELEQNILHVYIKFTNDQLFMKLK